MLRASFTTQFRRDLKRMQKRGKEIDAFKRAASLLVNEESLPHRYRDHRLKGPFVGYRECHLEPDWLLIYKVSDDEIIFQRTGTHSDLFG